MSETLRGQGYQNNDVSGWENMKPIYDEHGATPGVRLSAVESASGPIDHDSTGMRSIYAEHGATPGYRPDPSEKYGTNDQELLNTVNRLEHANWVPDLQSDIGNLPPQSLSELIGYRFRQSANLIEDRWSDKDKLSQDMYFDLSIIAATIDSGKELPGIDVAVQMGQEDVRSLTGVLDAYTEKIQESGKDVLLVDGHQKPSGPNTEAQQKPLNALDVIAVLKKSIENKSQNA